MSILINIKLIYVSNKPVSFPFLFLPYSFPFLQMATAKTASYLLDVCSPFLL